MGTLTGKDRQPLDASQYKIVAASQTTAQISVSNDGCPGRDYIERLVITAASTAAPGTVTLLDGTTNVGVYGFVAASMVNLTQVVDLGILATSTKGFNITTGTSVSVVAVGRFG